MLTNKNRGSALGLLLVALAWCPGLTGCAPPGQRALLQGKKLVDDGRYADAVAKLEKATSLLPKYAPGWNYLGLAYQGNRQPEQALKAYRMALTTDHKLAAARYNMGCLLVEQNSLPAAIDELRSYTLLQPSAFHGWLKLGSAQLRAQRLDEAEKSFRAALELQPRHPEALNGLGLVQYQRRRWQEALNHFNAAVAQDATYAPALLNSALVSQQQLGARPLALRRYRQYLTLQPRPAAADAVELIARQLETDIGGANLPAKRAATNLMAQAAPRTNAIASLPPIVRTAAPPSTVSRTNILTSSPIPAKPLTPTSPAPSNITVATSRSAAETSAPPRVPATATRPSDVSTTLVENDLVVKPAQDLAAAAPGATSSGATAVPSTANVVPPASPKGTNASKKSFLARLNPFAGKSKNTATPVETTTLTDPAPAPTVTSPVPATPATEPPVVPRYAYLSPAKPSAGNRADADKAFRRGNQAQQTGDRVRAIAEYQAALQADPAFFNAYYNLGLAALDLRNLPLALAAYETALALNPESADARYNFALALKGGGYYRDAAEQLNQILQTDPEDTRAHLALANLQAQQLRQPQLAREHYLKVLELNPRHLEAGKIRFWLTANP